LEIDSNTSASKSWPYELSRAPYEVTLYKIQQMLAYRNIQEKGKKIFGKPRWQCNMYMVRFFELRVALAEVMYKDPFLHTIVADLKVKRQSEMNHHNNRPEWVCELYRRGSAVVRAEMDAIVYMQEGAVDLGSREIVVAQGVKTVEEVQTWMSQHRLDNIKSSIVPTESCCSGEVPAWLQFVVDRYDSLPEYTVFLADAGNDWHTNVDWTRRIRHSRPQCRDSLGTPLHDKNFPEPDEEATIQDVMDTFGLAKYDPEKGDGLCCSEQVVSRASLLQYPVSAYATMLALVRREPAPHTRVSGNVRNVWGFAFERVWAQLFNTCPTTSAPKLEV